MLESWHATGKRYEILVQENSALELTHRVFVRGVSRPGDAFGTCWEPAIERACMMWFKTYREAVTLQEFLEGIDADF